MERFIYVAKNNGDIEKINAGTLVPDGINTDLSHCSGLATDGEYLYAWGNKGIAGRVDLLKINPTTMETFIAGSRSGVAGNFTGIGGLTYLNGWLFGVGHDGVMKFAADDLSFITDFVTVNGEGEATGYLGRTLSNDGSAIYVSMDYSVLGEQTNRLYKLNQNLNILDSNDTYKYYDYHHTRLMSDETHTYLGLQGIHGVVKFGNAALDIAGGYFVSGFVQGLGQSDNDIYLGGSSIYGKVERLNKSALSLDASLAVPDIAIYALVWDNYYIFYAGSGGSLYKINDMLSGSPSSYSFATSSPVYDLIAMSADFNEEVIPEPEQPEIPEPWVPTSNIELYPAMPRSPISGLTGPISSQQINITVEHPQYFLPGPNVAVINPDEINSETILYAEKVGSQLMNCIRGWEPAGSERSWPAGTPIARSLTAQDINSLQQWIVELISQIDDLRKIVEGGGSDPYPY